MVVVMMMMMIMMIVTMVVTMSNERVIQISPPIYRNSLSFSPD